MKVIYNSVRLCECKTWCLKWREEHWLRVLYVNHTVHLLPINISSSKCTLWYTDDILIGQVCLRMGCRGNYWWSERRSAKDWWRKVYNGEIYHWYFYPNCIKVIKSRRTGWAGHVARVWSGESYVGFEGEKLIERNCFQELGMDGRLIRKRRWKKQHGWILSGFIWFYFLIGAGLCDHWKN